LCAGDIINSMQTTIKLPALEDSHWRLYSKEDAEGSGK
jgi:hypothetical protein